MNVKNHRIYSDKFILNVVDLTQIELATEEDKKYQIDRWARLFKATTWEELKMIASKDTDLTEAAKTLYTMNCDKTIRDMCRAREDFERHERSVKRKMEQLTADKKQLTAENDALKKLLEEHGISYTTPPEEQ
jgi:hypothetical protein